MTNNDLKLSIEAQLIPHLNPSMPLVIMGDFNIDVSRNHGHIIKFLNDSFVCKLLTKEPTTDNLTTLDHIYSNIEDGIVGTIETYWSDHKIVYFYT